MKNPAPTFRSTAMLMLATGCLAHPLCAQGDADVAQPAPLPPPIPAPVAERFHQTVQFSPDGAQLAYSEFAGGDFSFDKWSIKIIALDESSDDSENEPRTLAETSMFFSFSPDGKRIAFDSPRDGNWDIYTVNTDGTDLRRVTTHEARDSQPAWSPGGDEIAFCSKRGGNSDLYCIAPDGTGLRRITTDNAENFTPQWSSDAASLVYYRELGDSKDQVHVVNRDGSNPRRITDGTLHNIYPSFLPGGDIAYTCVDGEGSRQLVRIAPDGSKRREVGDYGASIATWSPDENQIAFIAGRWPKSAIYLMNADGSNVRKVVN